MRLAQTLCDPQCLGVLGEEAAQKALFLKTMQISFSLRRLSAASPPPFVSHCARFTRDALEVFNFHTGRALHCVWL